MSFSAHPTVRRVALVISELRCGGAERVVVHLATSLHAQNVAVKIICMREPGALAAEAQAAGIEVYAIQSLRGYDLCAVWRLLRELQRFRPDVINVHDRSSLPYVVAANRFGGRRPVVFSAHGLLMQDEQPRRSDLWAARELAGVTAVSPTAAAEYARLLGWQGDVAVIDNGVPAVSCRAALRDSVRRDLNLPANVFAYLAMGNVKPEKGFADLLAAAAQLRVLTPDRKFTVLIAGAAADSQCYASLLRQQQELGLGEIVRFLGYRSDAPSLYSAADAFVLSSRKEGLPMALLEAMAAGLPIVATSVGAVPDAVRDKLDGLIAAPANPPDLAHAMADLLCDAEQRRRLAESAQRRAQETYTVDAMANRYLAAYQKALAAPRNMRAKAMQDTTDKPRVLMLGPMPPLTGGMATVLCNLRDSELHQWCELTTLNTGKTTPEGRAFWVGVGAQLKLLWTVLSIVCRQRIQIVHIHTCALFSFWRDIVHMLAVRAIGCHVVWHIHDGTFPRFISVGPAAKLAVIRWTLRRGTAAIVLSDDTLAQVQRHAPSVPWRIVPNGVPLPALDAAAPTGDNAAPTPLRLLFLGNLTHRKGAYDLITAVELANSRGNDVAAMLAGGGISFRQRQELEQRIGVSTSAAQIHVLGMIHGAEKERAICEADCVVLPSYAEGLPMALLEGMAAGMPAIATRVGAVATLIDDGVEGFLVEPGDVDALADRIGRLSQDAALQRQMGAAARQRVEQQFSARIMAERVYEIYRESLSQ